MIYSPARVHVEAGRTASLSIQLPSGVTDYESGLTFWAFDDEGSVAKFGPVTQSGSGITIAGSSVSGDVRTVNMSVSGIFSDVGYTVFVSFGTEVETTKIVYGGSAGFPIAKIVEAIYKLQVSAGSLRREAQRAMRSPEADDDQILPMREIRKGRVLGFDAYGRPVSGLKNISEAKEFLDEMKRILADLVANADKMLEEFAETAKQIMDEKVAEATEIADNARKVCEALAKEIREIRDRIEKLYAELTRYRYEVLTREEYEAKKAAGTLEADVIYFVKGTVAINDTLERLEEALSSLSEAYSELSARHDADVAALEGTIQATSDALDAAFAEATAAIEALEGKHDAESLAATQRLNDLQGGLQTLKARVDALQGQADASTAGVAENAAGIAELQQSLTEKTDALRGLIDALTTQVGDGDAANNAIATELLGRMDAAEAKNDEQDAGIAGNAGEIAALKAQLEAALNDDIPTMLDFYTQAIADLQAKSGVATLTFSGTSKLSTATVMDVNDGRVGHDSNGALRVASASRETNGTVYLPTHEWSALSNAAASLVLLRKKANALSIECGATASSENCNQYSFVGPLSSLGVTGAAADLNSVTFYRRANATPNGDTQVYLRLLKKVVGADGNAAWQIASQSVNAVAFSAQPINGDKCGTFYMRRVAGVEPPTCAETVALVMVGAADAEVNTSLQFGCKVAPSTTGGVCVSIPIADAITSDKGGVAVVPLVDVTWTPCAPAVGAASYDAPGVVQLSLAATLIDDPLGIGKQPDGRIVCDMAQVRAVVNAAIAGAIKIAESEDDTGENSILNAAKTKELLALKADKTANTLGSGASANYDSSVALGPSATASGQNSIALGYKSKASGEFSSTAVGNGAIAGNLYSSALGINANASRSYSTALGCFTTASGPDSVALGNSATASENYSTALGCGAKAIGKESAALLLRATASGRYSMALGYYTTASGVSSTALGDHATSNKDYSTALGAYANATGHFSVALGWGADAIGECSTAIGADSNASGLWSTALGRSSKATGEYSTALGRSSNATGEYSTALGQFSTASGSYATALGYSSMAKLDNSTALFAANPTAQTKLRIVAVAGATPDESYFVFQHEDVISAVGTGVKISASKFFAMLKSAGGEDYTTTSEAEVAGGGDSYYGSSYGSSSY